MVAKRAHAPSQPLPTDVVDVVETGSLPGIPARGVPPTPGTVGRIRARLSQEYVTAGQYQFYLNYLRSQPYAFDDLTRDVGVDVYEKMQHDSQVAKLIIDFKSGMLSDDVTFISPIEDSADPDHDAAVDLAAWVTWIFDKLETPLSDVTWDLASGIADGSRMAELVYELGPDRDGEQALLLTRIKVKPRTSIAYVVDSFNNLVGVLGMVPGQPFMPQTGLIITDPAFIANFLPRDKFCLFTFRPENADPRGTSILRAAYDPWWVKQQVKRSFVRYLDRFASPSLIGTTPDGAEPETAIDENGDVSVSGMSPEEWMAERLAAFQNATAMAFPFGSKVDILEARGDGKAFIDAFAFVNNELAGAILGQTLSTEQSQHQTQGAGKVHQDTKDTLMKQARKAMARMIANDIVRWLVLWNKGEDALRFAPKVVVGGVEQHLFGELAAGIAALATAGFLGTSQYPGIDQMLGLPTRDVDADEEDAQAAVTAQAEATARAHAALAPPTPPAPAPAQRGAVANGAPGAPGTPAAPAPAGAPPRTGAARPAPPTTAPRGTGKRAGSFGMFASARPRTVTVATAPAAADAARIETAYRQWAKEEQDRLWP